jgi:hypothetical protein
MAVFRWESLRTLRCQVYVVWVFRKTLWIALVTIDPTLTIPQIVGYYGTHWKIEAEFREIKHELGSAETQTRNPDAMTNPLSFRMAATTVTWTYATHLHKAPARRYARTKRTEHPFCDLRRLLAKDLGGQGSGIVCQAADTATQNPLIGIVINFVA